MKKFKKLNIIMYHYVRPIKNSKFPKIKGLEVSSFKKQLDYLSQNFNFITAEQLIAYSYGLHRIQEISCSDVGTIKLGLFDLKIKQDIFINYKTNLYGFVQIEVLDSDNKIILSSEKLVGDEYIKKIVWFDNQHILLDGKYYINVILSNASLFSFKI